MRSNLTYPFVFLSEYNLATLACAFFDSKICLVLVCNTPVLVEKTFREQTPRSFHGYRAKKEYVGEDEKQSYLLIYL